MKFKTAYRYLLSDVKLGVGVFYLVFIGVVLLLWLTQLLAPEVDFTNSGMEIASGIFLLCTGLNCFKPMFLFFMANGVSRRTHFFAFLALAGTLSAGMAILGRAFEEAFRALPRLHYQSLYGMLYQGGGVVTQIAWGWGMLLAFCTLGYCITLLYYRLGTTAKVLVSVIGGGCCSSACRF